MCVPFVVVVVVVALLLCGCRFRRASSGLSTIAPCPALTQSSLAIVGQVDSLLGVTDAFVAPFAAAARVEAALLGSPLLRFIASEHFLPVVAGGGPVAGGRASESQATDSSSSYSSTAGAKGRQSSHIVVEAGDVPALEQAAHLLSEAIQIMRRAVSVNHMMFARTNIIAGASVKRWIYELRGWLTD